MKTKTILFALCLLILIACLLGLTVNENNTNSIRLRFNSNYKGDSIEIQKIGLIWALSYLGADLPKQSFENALKKLDKSNYELHVDRIGFEPFAIKAMQVIIKSLKQSEEYKKMGGIDLDEFVVYTLGSSNHYYQITGAKQTYTQFKSNFDFSKEQVFPVLNSDVAKHHRLIRMSDSKKVSKMAFIAEEGVGDLVTKTFQAEVFEVFDIMKNGQLRFAIYDKTGNLMEASPASLGNAGKPVKCLWCHEINIQSLFTKNDSVKDYISPRQFQELIRNKMQALQDYRITLKGEVDLKIMPLWNCYTLILWSRLCINFQMNGNNLWIF